MWRPGPATWVALFAALAVAPYLGGGPVWDDHSLIFGHLAQLDGPGLLALWTRPVGGGEVGVGYFRPLAMTLMALLSRGGMLPLHLLTLLCHVGASVLLLRLLKPAPAATWAAALFALHPLASEVLGWASALPDALAVSLGLAGALLARRSLLGAGLVTLLALLCKESALLILPFAVAAERAPRKALAPWLGAGLLALGLRLAAGAGAAWAVAGKGLLAVQALLWTVGSLVFPWPLTPVRDLHAVPLTGLLAGILVLLGGPLLLRWRKAPALGWAGFALVVAAPLLALPPTLHGYLAAERYSYPGLVGFAALVAALAPALPAPSRPMAMALLGPALLLHLLLAGRWADDRQLFSDAVDALPESAYAWHFLGQAQALAGDPAAAAVAFGEACARPHAHPLDRRLRLQALVLSGQAREAVAWAEAGPQEGLGAEDIAWWARAARDAGQADDARRLLSMLREQDGWAGPDWVPALARELGI